MKVPTLLLIDDDNDLANLIVCYLQHLKIEIIHKSCCITALEYLSTNNVSYIVSDVNIPKMNGIEFFERYKTLGYTSPVIFFSAYLGPKLMARLDLLCPYNVITKPDVSSLRNELIKLIERHQDDEAINWS